MGAAAVRALLRRGARVVVGDLSEESFGNNLVNHLKNDGDNGLLSDNNIQFCRVDVTQPETITAALDVVQDVFGIPVNAVVNSAGIATVSKTVNKKGQTSTKAMDEFIRTMEINTIGSFHVARLAAERMAATPLGQPPSLMLTETTTALGQLWTRHPHRRCVDASFKRPVLQPTKDK